MRMKTAGHGEGTRLQTYATADVRRAHAYKIWDKTQGKLTTCKIGLEMEGYNKFSRVQHYLYRDLRNKIVFINTSQHETGRTN